MFMAYTASLRSADLSRQVGAAILSKENEIVALGANDVPKAGGGQYWPSDEDFRDFQLGHDSNETKREQIVDSVINQISNVLKQQIKKLKIDNSLKEAQTKKNKNIITNIEKKIQILIDLPQFHKNKKKSGGHIIEGNPILDITEYGRAVHAEMEAILSSNRSGTDIRGGTLFCTTFPCHNCAKHIVGAGISRVVYIEPYPKSMARTLHKDSIVFRKPSKTSKKAEKVIFEPFIGVGPRRYFDLFSMKLSSGYPLPRKQNNEIIRQDRAKAQLRIQMIPLSYLDKEDVVIKTLTELNETKKEGGHP